MGAATGVPQAGPSPQHKSGWRSAAGLNEAPQGHSPAAERSDRSTHRASMSCCSARSRTPQSTFQRERQSALAGREERSPAAPLAQQRPRQQPPSAGAQPPQRYWRLGGQAQPGGQLLGLQHEQRALRVGGRRAADQQGRHGVDPLWAADGVSRTSTRPPGWGQLSSGSTTAVRLRRQRPSGATATSRTSARSPSASSRSAGRTVWPVRT